MIAAVSALVSCGLVAAGREVQAAMHGDMEARAGQPAVGGDSTMRAPVLSASAAGAGVVMASRPKNGTAMPS